jgi:hypothetical protein
MKKLIIDTRSTTGKLYNRQEVEYDKNIHKVIVTVDTAYLFRIGADITTEMQTAGQMIANGLVNIKQPVIVIPEWIKVQAVNIEGLKEDMENVKEENSGNIINNDNQQ